MARSQPLSKQLGSFSMPEIRGSSRAAAARGAAAELGLTPRGADRAMLMAFHRVAVFARHLVAHGADLRLTYLMAELDAVRATVPGAREAAEFFAHSRFSDADPDRGHSARAM